MAIFPYSYAQMTVSGSSMLSNVIGETSVAVKVKKRYVVYSGHTFQVPLMTVFIIFSVEYFITTSSTNYSLDLAVKCCNMRQLHLILGSILAMHDITTDRLTSCMAYVQ